MDLRTALQMAPKREVTVPHLNGTLVAHVTALPVTMPVSHENQTARLHIGPYSNEDLLKMNKVRILNYYRKIALLWKVCFVLVTKT
jgi:hypothetical protein